MKRDWNLVRQILLKLEDKPDTQGTIHPNQFSGWDEETVSEHLRLLDQAGLIEAICDKPNRNTPTFCMARNLTWVGHEFLDAVRSDSAWNRIGHVAKEKGLELSLDTIKQIASALLAGIFA